MAALGPISVTVDPRDSTKMYITGDGLVNEGIIAMLDRYFAEVLTGVGERELIVFTLERGTTADDVREIVEHCRQEALG